MSTPESEPTINLAKATVLVLEGNQHALDVTAQILKGFGVAFVLRATSVPEAEQLLRGKTTDLIIVDPSVQDGGGYEFIRDLRRAGSTSSELPVVLTGGHFRRADVERARDSGANFVVKKPISASVLLQRILWVTQDARMFIDVGDYVGPDRRFKFEGPPEGSDGRRASDLKSPIGDISGPNMSQSEVDTLIKPQRVTL
jgi:CheY-like chemotaxis protein